MADRFEDPRVEGELRELNAKLSRIEKNVQEAEAAARKSEQRTRRSQAAPARGAAEPTLDDDYRQTEAARRRANDEERTAKARRDRARSAEAEAKADRFYTRAQGTRTVGVFDRESGDRVRGFRGPSGVDSGAAQGDALRRAEQYAATLNQAARSAERIGNELIRHPQLFGAAQRAAAQALAPLTPAAGGGGGRFLPPGPPPSYVPFGEPPRGLPAGSQQRQLTSGDRAWDETARRARARGPLGHILEEEGHAAKATGESYERASTQARGYYDTVAFGSRAGNLAGNELRRRGALTTEFIQAAARGQTTIRELGYQVGATTAKFAGWTAAAGFIYGALGAIRELGRGAIDTAEGVNTLQRIIPQIDTGRATQELQSLSREFNLPIKDVADAAYGISKTFGAIADPAEAARRTFIATRSALFLVKIGELDAATATRYLTSIIQGFNLEAAEMPRLTDTINAAQNRFGGNVGQIAQGVAGAAGAFRAAGSDYRELISLISVGQRVTGRTGQEIGTALRRTSEIYRRPERRQKIIDLLGIDPADTSIYDLIQRAQDVAAKRGPDVARAIAKAISTPELASGRILPILQARELTDVVHTTLSPGNVKGSAENELDRALKGPLEKLQRLRVDMQLLGSELAESGFLAPFGTLVATLDQALHLVERIAKVVGDLPSPLRTALAYGLPAGAVVGAARRLDVGGGSGILGRNAGARTRANILTGIQAEEELVLQERARSVNEMVSSQRRADRFGRRLADLTGEGADIDNRRAILENQRNAALRTAAESEDELNDLTQRSATLQGQRRVVERSRFRSQAEVIRRAEQAGVPYVQPGLERPLAAAPIPLGGVGSGEAAARQQAAQTSRLAQRAERFNASVSGMGRSGRVLGATATRGAAVAAGAGRTLSGAGGALSRMGTGLLGALGPIDLLIAGLIAFGLLADQLHQQEEGVQRAAREMNRAVGTGDLAAAIRGNQQYIDSTGAKIAAGFQEVENVGIGLARFAGGDTHGGIDQIFGGADTPREEAQRNADRQRRLLAFRRRQQQQDRLLYQSDIRRRARNEFDDASGSNADQERAEAIANAERLYGQSLFSRSPRLRRRAGARAEAARTRDLIAQLKGEAGATAQHISAFRQQLDELDSAASAEVLVQGLQLRISRRGVGPTLPRVAQALQALRTLVGNVRGEDRAKVLQQIATLQDDVLSRLETRFQQTLQSGGNPRQARRRYLNTAFLALFQVRTEAELRELQDRRRRLRAFIREMDRILSVLEGQADQALGELAAGALGERQNRATRRLGRARQLLGRLGPSPTRDDFNHFRQLQRDSQDAVDQIEEQAAQDAEQRLQEAISLFQAQQRNASARALIGATQGARLGRAVSDAQSFLGFVQSHGGDQLAILDAQTAVFEAQDALAQYVKEQAQALVRAKAEFARSRTYDPVKVAEIALREAQELLQYAETPAERIQGLADINNKRRELQNTRVSERVDQQQFLFDLGKLTREQYITWIQRFLRAHGELRRVNRDMFRQLRRTLHQLRTETEEDLDLQVGNIRLPTLYDVRRIIQQGTRTAPSQLVQQNSIAVHPPPGSDPEAIGQAVYNALSTAGKSGMRAAGVT